MSDLGWMLIGWIGYIACALLGGVYLKKLYAEKRNLRIAYACVSAALLIAGLCGKGRSVVTDRGFVARGYEAICEKFRGLGGRIWENRIY